MASHITVPAPPLTLMRQLDRHAAEKPETIAFRFARSPDLDTDDLSWAQLRTRALRVAHALRQRHASGNRVLLVLPAGLDYIAGFLGCLYAGAIAVPIFPPRRNRPPERFARVATDSAARFALTTPEIRRQIETTLAPALLDELALEWLSPEGETGAADPWPCDYVDGDSPAFLQYTSGSTAEPKGVLVTHGNLAHNLALFAEPFDMAAADVLGVNWLPPFHDLGLIGNLLGAVHYGVTEVLMAPQAFLSDPLGWLRAISHFRGSASAAPNFAYDLCAARATPEFVASLDLSCWKTAFCGAEPIVPATLERFARTFASCGFSAAALCPGYGLAEATLAVSAQRKGSGMATLALDREALRQGRVAPVADSAAALRVAGSGRVLGGQRVVIVDPETHRLCPPDRIGEIWIAGASVARGYWANPAATRETFRARLQPTGDGPFLRTGDLGFFHADQLYVSGRCKDLIIIGGTNHFPQDIELTARAAHPALADAAGAAFAVMTDQGESLAVVHEINLQHRSADFAAVAAALRAAVSEAHQVAIAHCALVRFATLPKTSSGKIQRSRCRDRFLTADLDAYYSTGARGNVTAPQSFARDAGGSPLPAADFAQLRDGIARILEVAPDQLDPDAPLLQQGMSSLRAVELQCLLDASFGCKLDYADFFEPWTVRRLAQLIAEKSVKAPDRTTTE